MWYLLIDVAMGACGLDHCPMPSSSPVSAQLTTRIDLGGYDAQEIEGTWGRWMVGGLVRPTPSVALHGALPLQVQSVGGSVDLGLGNGLIGIEASPTRHPWRPVAGLQIETPTGSRGVSEAHWSSLAYAGGRRIGDLLWFDAQAGLRAALDGIPSGGKDHDGASTLARIPSSDHTETTTGDPTSGSGSPGLAVQRAPLIIEPHEHLEVVGRCTIGINGAWSAASGLDVVGVLGTPRQGPRMVLDARATVGHLIAPRVRGTVTGRVPLTRPGRFDWWLGAQLTVSLTPALPTGPNPQGS